MFPLADFNAYIHKNALFNKAHKILLAVSGGRDSVLMAQLFKLANYQFSIAHCNFNLRGDEAQRDETFVKLLAADLDVPFYVAHFDTKAYAEAQQVSIQMAARELRYAWFEEIRLQGGYDCIALAHHQNDAIETLLLNLVRGTGISGMHGILAKKDYLVRPLLFLTKAQIDVIASATSLSYIEDSSNESTKYARNKIRLQVIPHLRELNPNLEETFAQNINRFAETEQVLQQTIKQLRERIMREVNGDCYIAIEEIKQLHPQKLLFFELLRPFGFTGQVVDEILASLDKQSGTSFYSSSHRATLNREDLLLSVLTSELSHPLQLLHPTAESISFGNQKISLMLTDVNDFEFHPNKAFVPFELLIFPLVVRGKENGDRFMPLGMRSFKKISDFLISLKIPLPQKEQIPILINGNGEVIWVAGLRQDNRYKLNATTKKVAIFELSNQ